MRKDYCLRICMTSIAIIMLCMAFGKVAKASNKVELKQLWYETNDYPISTESEEWYDYGMEDMFDILNPPQELLNSYSSEKLAELMLKHPYLWVLPTYEFDNRQLFFAYIRNSDIFNELMLRDDGITRLLEAYRDTAIDLDLLNSDLYVIWKLNQTVNAEIFGCQFINLNIESFSTEERMLANQIKEEKRDTYSNLIYYDTKLYLNFENGSREGNNVTSDSQNIMNPSRTEYGFTALSSPITRSICGDTIWFTPGTYHKYSVYSSCLKWYANDYTIQKRNSLDGSIAYSWTMVAHSSPKYNCHSFAWIWNSSSNDFWLDSPSTYMGSSEVTYVGHNVTPLVGDKIVFYDNNTNAINHSAVVISTPAGATGIYVRSKIGGMALYDSPLSEVATYYNALSNYNVYR